MRQRILIAEDDESLRRVAEYNLREEGYEVATAADGLEAACLLKAHPPDLLLTDLRMPGLSGLEVMRQVHELQLDTEVILVTAFGTVDDAVLAMKEGAFDFVTKPVRWEELRLTVARALERLRLRRETTRLRRELEDRYSANQLIGGSPAMVRIREEIHRAADSSAPVLILGESGTGKELVARALHYLGSRGSHPFVVVNCAALPRELVEAELMGVRRGAYTGADRDRPGRFAEAHQGSLFLDEVGELGPDLQVKLLRVVEERQVTPLGGNQPVPAEVRILAATNRPIEQALESGQLRPDLYYRLNAITIVLPPLRQRREDLPPMVEHFLNKLGAPSVTVSPQAMDRLLRHSWPGNVRELENAVARALLFRKEGDCIAPGDLPPGLGEAGPRPEPQESMSSEPAPRLLALPAEGLDLYRLERDLIVQALLRTSGNRTRAAQLLGMTRQTLIYRMQKHGIEGLAVRPPGTAPSLPSG